MSCTSTQQCSIPRYRVRCVVSGCRLCLKRDGTRAETRFRLTAKRTSAFKSAGASVQSTAGSRGVRMSGSNAGYTMFRGSVKGTGYPLHSPSPPSFPLPCVTLCHHISSGFSKSTQITCTTNRIVCPQTTIYNTLIPTKSEVTYRGLHLDQRLT